MDSRVWLVRHGQTDWNSAGRVQGHTPTELNDAGWRQAKSLAGVFRGRNFAAVWSSDLPRAAQTAEVIAEVLGLKVEQTEALRERSFGKYEGATWEEIRAARLALGLPQTNDLADWTGVPGIESNDALWERVDGTLRKIAQAHLGKDILVVTHGGVIARAVYRTLGIPDGWPRRFPLSNGIVAVLQVQPQGWRLVTLADMGLILRNQASADTASQVEGGTS